MNPEELKDPDLLVVRQHLEQLGEFFDAVQIFATRHEPSSSLGTIYICDGCGNFMARRGQVAEWLIRQDEIVREHARSFQKEDEGV